MKELLTLQFDGGSAATRSCGDRRGRQRRQDGTPLVTLGRFIGTGHEQRRGISRG
jgi:hypothetical protein